MFRVVCMTAALAVSWIGAAAADQWNDKTTLKFSDPVIVPGATLQPGTYVFKLMDLSSTRHTVQITNEDGSKVVTIAHAVPMKRTDASGDVVLKLNPTGAGSPPALKGWFYPGSLYGHEFVYPEDQARQIAGRTKTLVLSIDVPGTDLEQGKLQTYDASGARADWHGDEGTLKEWEEWRANRRAAANVASPPAVGEEQQEATAPMVKSAFEGIRVKLDALEDDPQKYIGQSISVDAEVEEVLGPRVFTIDEPNWVDLEGETLVFMPTSLAALVKEHDRVTVTGTVKRFVRAEIERGWAWLDLDRELEIDLGNRPVLVASRIVGGNDNRAMVITLESTESKPVGTSGSAAAPTVTDPAKIAAGDDDLVGHQVNVKGLKVQGTAEDGGFFAATEKGTIFVLPASADTSTVRPGDAVSITGVVLQLPRHMRSRLKAPTATTGFNGDIYVYARRVSK